MMSKTIKEIADEVGVSKTAIRKKMSDEFKTKWVTELKINGVRTLVIADEGANLLKSMFQENNSVETQGESLETIIEILRDELEQKNEQISNLQMLLNQSQQLLREQNNVQLLLESNTRVDTETYDEIKSLNQKLNFFKIGIDNTNQRMKKSQYKYFMLLTIVMILMVLLAFMFFLYATK